MSAEENKTIVRRFVDEVQSGGNIDAIDELCSPEFVNHSAPPGVPSNCEGVKQLTAMFRLPRFLFHRRGHGRRRGQGRDA